jgi:hypothetical protein
VHTCKKAVGAQVARSTSGPRDPLPRRSGRFIFPPVARSNWKTSLGFLPPICSLICLAIRSSPVATSSFISAREPDARALLDLRWYGDRSVGHPNFRYASNHVLFVFHVAWSSETEHTRYGVTPPVFSEGTFGQILLEHFQGGLSIS